MKKKNVKEVKMHKFSVCACKSQDFVQSHKIFVRLHDRETVTFRNSALAYQVLRTPPLILFFAYKMQFFKDPSLAG